MNPTQLAATFIGEKVDPYMLVLHDTFSMYFASEVLVVATFNSVVCFTLSMHYTTQGNVSKDKYSMHKAKLRQCIYSSLLLLLHGFSQ